MPPDSERIETTLNEEAAGDSRVDAIAFRTPTKQIVLVAHNSDAARAYRLRIESAAGGDALVYELSASSIVTIVWNESDD